MFNIISGSNHGNIWRLFFGFVMFGQKINVIAKSLSFKSNQNVSNNHHTFTCNHHFVWKKGKCVFKGERKLENSIYGDDHHEYCYNFNVCVFFLHQNSQASNDFFKVIYII